MKMNHAFRYLLLAGALVFASSASFADTTYNFSYSGAGNSLYAASSASGTFTVDASGLVTGLTGFRDGTDAMTLLDVNAFASNDNLFSTVGTYFDINGLSFSAGSVMYNLAYYAGQGGYAVNPSFLGYLETYDQYGNPSGEITFDAAATPEPGSLILFGSGALALAGMIRRKLPLRNPLTASTC